MLIHSRNPGAVKCLAGVCVACRHRGPHGSARHPPRHPGKISQFAPTGHLGSAVLWCNISEFGRRIDENGKPRARPRLRQRAAAARRRRQGPPGARQMAGLGADKLVEGTSRSPRTTARCCPKCCARGSPRSTPARSSPFPSGGRGRSGLTVITSPDDRVCSPGGADPTGRYADARPRPRSSGDRATVS